MTDIPYHRIAQQFYNRPLFLMPSAAQSVSAYLMGRMQAGPGGARALNTDAGTSTQAFPPSGRDDGSVEFHSPRASQFYGVVPRDADGRPAPYRRTAEGVAIITLVGEFVNRGAWVGASSGLISYEGVKFQVQRAAADPDVRAILIDMESPGGEAVGAFEAAEVIREVSKQKPLVTVVNGMAASAGYALASGSRRIVTTPTGISGSVGVVLVHLDFSMFLEVEGVKPTLIFAGARKVDGNPFEPLPDGVREELQVEVNDFYDQFIATVAAGRDGLSAAQVRGTEARVFKGVKAVDAGLADAVGTFEEVLAELSAGSHATSSVSPTMKEKTMTGKTKGSADQPATPDTETNGNPKADEDITLESIKATFPKIAEALRTEGATAERARILGIEASALPGHEALVEEMKNDPSVSKADAASRILDAEKDLRAKQGEGLKGVEQHTGKVPAAPNTDAPETSAPKKADTPEEWRKEYESDSDLQAQFSSADTYVAYMKNRDKVRILSTERRSA